MTKIMHLFFCFPVCLLFLQCVAANAQTTPGIAKRLYVQIANENNDTLKLYRILQLVTYQIKKPGEYKADLDSAEILIRRAEKINSHLNNEKYKGLIALNKAYFNKKLNNTEIGKKFAEKSVSIFSKIRGDFSLLGESYFELSQFYNADEPGGFKAKEKYLLKAAYNFQRSGDYEKESISHRYLGSLLMDQGNNISGKKEVELALQIGLKAPNAKLEAIYDLLASAECLTENYQRAIYDENVAIKQEQHDADTVMMETSYTRLLIIYDRLNEYRKALFYGKKALVIEEHLRDTNAVYITASNINRELSRFNKNVEALKFISDIAATYPKPSDPDLKVSLYMPFLADYTALYQTAKAQHYLDLLLPMLKKNYDDVYVKESVYRLAVNFYISSKNYPLSQRFEILYSNLARHFNNKIYLARNSLMQFRIDSAQQHLESAMDHLLKWHKLSTDIQNETNTKAISDIEAEYEADKREIELQLKDQNIKVLTQNEQLQKLNLKKAASLSNELIGGSCLLLIILILLIYQNQLRKKNQKAMAKKNKSMELLLVEKESLIKDKESLLEDKEVLIQEIHHRVKNNLHMISSLLESQSAFLADDALLAIRKSQNRVQALSLIHQKLYVNDNVTDVLMSVYLRELINYLKDSFVTDENIIFHFDLDPIQLDIKQAVPVGLIVNEVLTNSIRFAFPSNYEGLIEISLKQKFINQIVLTIRDNGIGLSEDFNIDESQITNHTLGMSLIKGLSKSLQGTVTFSSEGGTKIELIFFNDHE